MKRSCPSLTKKIKCRFCKEELRERNYSVHIQRKHENGNFTDTRDAGQTSIAAFVKPQNTKDGSCSLSEIIEVENFSQGPTAISAEPSNPSIVETLSEGSAIITTCADNNEASPSEPQLPTVFTGNLHSVDDKLDNILGHIMNLENEIVHLKSDLENRDKTESEEQSKDNSADINYLFQSCRSISDITSIFDEFEYDKSTCCIICRICVPRLPSGNPMPKSSGINSHPAVFVYNPECGTNFSIGCNLPTKFRSLKQHLKEHLLSKLHLSTAELREKAEEKEEQYRSREREVGLRIGRIAYRLYYKGHPYSDFEDDIALAISNGCDLGDINHSIAFAKRFLPYVSELIATRLKNYMNSRLVQTGFQPPVKIIADKATWKHRTRHFIMVMTVVPDSDELIHAIYLGHPVIKAHTGKAVAESIISCISEWEISKTQYIGGSFDGQYFKLGVPNHLNDHFTSSTEESDQKPFYYDWDPMHKAALVDDHMRKNEKCAWVVMITQTICSIFAIFNWGKEYENLNDVISQLSEESKSAFKNPCFYSETRFANSVKKVYENFRQDYKGIVTVLEEKQMGSLNGNTSQRQKGVDADLQMNKILNVKFCLLLSGLCDLYDQFSKIIDILQKVNILPHERYAKFIKKINHLKSMSYAVNADMCPHKSDDTQSEEMKDEIECFWPHYHSDKALVESVGEYQGVPLCLPEPEESINLTRSQAKKQRLDIDAVKLTVEKELQTFALLMAEKFNKNVFTADDVILFDHVKNITDLKLLATKLKHKGIPLTTASHMEKFLFSAQKLVFELKDVPISELHSQYRTFLCKLEEITKHMSEKEFAELTSIEIIQKFLSGKKPLHQNVELILHCICVSSIVFSIESVCESLTSRYEFHSNQRRRITEKTAHHEMMISVNGPLPTKCDRIILQAMAKYFTKQGANCWHFIRRSHNLKNWIASKSVDKLMKKDSPLSFMDI